MTEEKNMPAFPCGVSQDHNNDLCEPAAWRLSKLEIFAMHAPEIPYWFVDKRKNEEHDNYFYCLEFDKNLFFEWRRYYAEQMIEELSK